MIDHGEHEHAFPLTDEARVQLGMTLRDWFAGQALIGILQGVEEPRTDVCARMAYELADAMLKERKR